tara:strand:- start:727 stop:981 length:255 start_codon:yes stop_codon:yes gene_type:complete
VNKTRSKVPGPEELHQESQEALTRTFFWFLVFGKVCSKKLSSIFHGRSARQGRANSKNPGSARKKRPKKERKRELVRGIGFSRY